MTRESSSSTLPPAPLVTGVSGAGAMGVIGAGGVLSGLPSSAPSPGGGTATHLVGQFHGIRTPEEVYSWPEFGSDWFALNFPHVRAFNSDYYESVFPRIAALRNIERAKALATVLQAGYEAQPDPLSTSLSLIGHSNGGVLTLQAGRRLVAAGIPLRTLVLIAPALRTRATTREVAEWIERGMLERAILIQPGNDGVIGLIAMSWRTKLLAWPWGSLGVDGWKFDEVSSFGVRSLMGSIFLPEMDHSDPVESGNRHWLYEQIIAPAMGLAPWDEFSDSYYNREEISL